MAQLYSNMIAALRCKWAILGLVLFALPGSVNAAVYVQTYDNVNNITNSGSDNFGPLSVVSIGTTITSSASAVALGDYGVNKVFSAASASAIDGFSIPQPDSNATSWWEDSLLVNTRGSERGFLKISLDVTSKLNVATEQYGVPYAAFSYSFLSSDTSYIISANAGSGYLNISSSGSYDEINRDFDGTISRYAFILIPFVANSAFDIRSRADCTAIARGVIIGETVTASCDAGNSIYWGGVIAVTDLNGNAVDGWSITSASGTDYAKSFVPIGGVPEPASWMLMIVGFGLMGAALRQRQPAGVTGSRNSGDTTEFRGHNTN
jgi:hypothetical protein